MIKNFKLSCCPLCGDKLALDIPDTVSYIPYDCFQTCSKHGEVSRFFWYPYAWKDKGLVQRAPFPDTTISFDRGYKTRLTMGRPMVPLNIIPVGYSTGQNHIMAQWFDGWIAADRDIEKKNSLAYKIKQKFKTIANRFI